MADGGQPDLALAGEFPAATWDEWRRLVGRALKGADFESRLVGKSYDGLRIEPLRARKPQASPVTGRAPGAVNIRFGLDPIGAAALAGGSALPWATGMHEFSAVIADLAARGFRGPFAAADARVIHDAGGSEVQELAYALAVAVQYLRLLEAAGLELD